MAVWDRRREKGTRSVFELFCRYLEMLGRENRIEWTQQMVKMSREKPMMEVEAEAHYIID
jgi:hypothetical protein